MALLLAESVAKHWGRGCDISIGTIFIISDLMNCIKRRTAIRIAHSEFKILSVFFVAIN